LGTAEVGNQRRIQFVGFVALQLAGGIGFDACRINHTHSIARFIQVRRHVLAVAAGRFQADGCALADPFVQVVIQLAPAFRRVGKLGGSCSG
jgi:hypothetical protein